MTALLLLPLFLAAKPLTLDDALATADHNQPTVRISRADLASAEARADVSRAELLPQISASADFTRESRNFVNYLDQPKDNWRLFNGFSASVKGTQVLLDLGLYARWKQAQAAERAARLGADDVRSTLHRDVRVAFFVARAKREAFKALREERENQEKHLRTVAGFVAAGGKPEIDLAQAKGSAASARFKELGAQADYETAKLRLNLEMGIEGPTDFEIADDEIPAVAGEDASLDELLPIAMRSRPELAKAQATVDASRLAVRASQAAFLPTVSANGRVTSEGPTLSHQVRNIRFGASLGWDLFSGLATVAQVRDAKAALERSEAQREQLLHTARLDLDSARRQVLLAKAEQTAAEEALVATNERLRLAEGRYAGGQGTIIELDDAQLERTKAAQQRIQADFDLYSARAELLFALGRI